MIRSYRSKMGILLALAMVLNLLVAASTASKATAYQRGSGDTLRIFFWQAPSALNPHLSPGQKDQFASRIVYEPLASYDKDGQMVPFLAAEIPSLENGGVARDGLSVTWKLKPGVKWSDGEAFTADDVLFTYEYVTNKEVGASTIGAYSAVKNVEVVDDTTVKVNFKAVNPAWTLPFVGIQGLIIPRHVFKDYVGASAKDAPPNLKPVGTGPYRLVDFKTEDILIIGEDTVNTVKLIYEPNPFFRDPGKPLFSKIELHGGGGDAKVAARVMQDGQADYAWDLQVDDATLNKVEAKGKSKIVIVLGPAVERILLNFTDPSKETPDGERSSLQFRHPFFTDKNVRQAFAYAIDREAIVKLYGRGGQLTTNLLVSPANYKSPNTSYTFDLQKAAALLDQAGWKDSDGDGIRDKGGVKLSVLYQTSVNPIRQSVQDIVKKALESIGVQVTLKKIDASVYFSPPKDSTNTIEHFYADMEEYSTNNKSPDPGAYMKIWTCDQLPQKANNWGSLNYSRYCNPDYDALYRKSATEIDPEKRRQLIIALNDMLMENVVLIPLVQNASVSAISTTLDGFNITPWDAETWNIADWTRIRAD
jgi:peptide/nickel transport system substrate-binding protein